MLRLLHKILLFFPVLLLIAGVNYRVDPANLFHQKSFDNTSEVYEKKIANYLAAGHNVTNVETLDERIFQRFLIMSMSEKRLQIVVLGSSRSQLIGNNLFPEKSILNNSVTGATIEDLLALINLYDSTKQNVDEIIIEMPPWYLNDNNGQLRWKSIMADYESFKQKLKAAKPSMDIFSLLEFSINPKFIELLSFEYFQQSVKKLRSGGKDTTHEDFFTKSNFKNGYKLGDFYKQLCNIATLKNQLPISRDTIEALNNYVQQPDLYDVLRKAYPDQEMPAEISSLHFELFSVKHPEKEFSTLQKAILYKLNRKILEAIFFETCPPSESQLTFPTNKKNNRGLTRLTDGTISYPETYRNQTTEEISFGVQSFLNTTIFGLGNFSQISSEKLSLLKATLDYLKNKNIKVKMILVPYHPDVYKVLTSDIQYKNALEAEKIFTRIAIEKEVEIKGSYDPRVFNLTSEDFYDAMHLKESALKKILN